MKNTKYRFRYEVGDIIHMRYRGMNVLITELIDGDLVLSEPMYRFIVLTSEDTLEAGEENWSFADTAEQHGRKLN